ncbi:MAG: AI-2E family transporter [Rhodocyclaceae bacterium]|jgi:predicted PurR-regulated permease PerM|uniref:AI-2E family transporter n=1 Tax=Candidatus Desulfobacillus denitrificans TaxID=2608985 RepID=A0A809QZC9_9PROT|nr:AI-2E family transporter [Zoogloeaceae bacterium]MBP9655721.1 AI-2E family transporter [Rhodocyclaceae bacterium]MCZ2174305.1 AI-2E family transporter [Burkholderiales bacterium]BBO20749.1 AI-2E family transporter [Candidatus Desulfobacillus denitrificans]GIK44318.1 MAG: AI-2E family transporter [Betaproteobacteria bacterium]
MRRASGPVVWAGIIASTCLLLFLFQKILWLVVPFLLAMIIYYFLQPATHRLVLHGFSRKTAAAITGGGFILLLLVCAALLFPWVSAHAVGWQASLARYVEGGSLLLQKTLAGLEAQFDFLERASLSRNVSEQIGSFTETFAQHHLADLILTLAAWLPSLLLAPFLAFFFLRDGRRFTKLIGNAVPNAFFERTLYLMHEMNRTARAYFQGLINLTIIDTVALAVGLWVIGLSAPLMLGLICAVLAWVPYVGSILGCLLVVLVAATDFPLDPWVAYGAIIVFILVRLLDDFVFMPLTIGRSLHMHPLLTVLMIFVGGAVAGVAGLMLVLPLLGIAMVVGETVGMIVTDPRLQARHAHARRLRTRQASSDLQS